MGVTRDRTYDGTYVDPATMILSSLFDRHAQTSSEARVRHGGGSWCGIHFESSICCVVSIILRIPAIFWDPKRIDSISIVTGMITRQWLDLTVQDGRAEVVAFLCQGV